MEETKEMKGGKTFRQMYLEEKMKPSAARQFIEKAASELGVCPGTIRLWLSERQQPSKFLKEKIEAMFDEKFETLFPTTNTEEK